MPYPWQIVELDSFKGTVYAKEGQLIIGDNTVSLADISVIILGINCSVHASAFDRFAAFEIPILHCDWKGIPYSVTMNWSENSRVATRHQCQANLSEPRKKNAWMQIIKAKIRGQAAVLGPINKKASLELITLSKKVRSGDLSNFEGLAAKMYWSALFGPAFTRVQSTREYQNGKLDYGYTILRGITLRAICATGLWPTLGIWHRNRSNKFGLVDDLMEPYRPAVDFIVKYRLKNTETLTRDEKQILAKVADYHLRAGGFTVGTKIMKLCQNFANYVESNTDKLSIDIFGGFDERE